MNNYISSYEKTVNLKTIKEDSDSITVEGYIPDQESNEYIADIHMEGVDKNGNKMILPCDITHFDHEKNIVNVDFKMTDNEKKEKHKKQILDLINIRIQQLENNI